MINEKRKLIQINKSFYIGLPKLWVNANGICRGDSIDLSLDPDTIILKKNEKQAKNDRSHT